LAGLIRSTKELLRQCGKQEVPSKVDGKEPSEADVLMFSWWA
jgi:hypothetical protein